MQCLRRWSVTEKPQVPINLQQELASQGFQQQFVVMQGGGALVQEQRRMHCSRGSVWGGAICRLNQLINCVDLNVCVVVVGSADGPLCAS